MGYLANKLGDENNLGYYATESALTSAYPIGFDGAFAIVGATDTFWVWDSGAEEWVDTNSGGGGGSVNFVSNVATARILGRVAAGSGDSQELTKAQTLTFLNVEDGADVTDTANVTSAGALMDSEVTNLAQVKAFDSSDYATPAGTETLTNKRITKRKQTVASSATVTPSWDNDDIVTITAQAVGLTLANPSGTPTDGQAIVIRILDNGTGRTIAYGNQYRAIGVTLLTTTTASKTSYLGGFWNAANSKFDITAVGEEA